MSSHSPQDKYRFTVKDWLGSIVWGTHPRYGHAFDYVMILLIVISVVCITLISIDNISAGLSAFLHALEIGIVLVFSVEYFLRIWTAPNRNRYIFSFWGIVDCVAILPFWLATFGLISANGSQAARLLRIMRVLRLLKLVRYVAAVDRLKRAAEIISTELLLFVCLSIITVLIAAVGIHGFEGEVQPENFGSIPQSLWFAVVTLTTVGYGDVYPITSGGKLFTGLILFLGIGIVAIPTGLIASALAQAREEENDSKDNDDSAQDERSS